MPSNKIGIEVQVEFPTVGELQKQLAEKWAKVKNGFEGKINVGVDGHSLNKVKKKIQEALDGKEFQIKLDSKVALGEIDLVRKELKKLDAEIDKVRQIRIKFDVGDMDKSMKEMIKNNQILEEKSEKTEKNIKDQTQALNRQLGAWDKIVRKYKEIDGKKVNTHVTTTYTDEQGKQITQRQDLKTGDVTEEQAYNKLKQQQDALKEIEDTMKRIHKIELDSMKAGKDELKILQDEKKMHSKHLELLKQMYYQKYKTNAISSTDLKEVQRAQNVAKAIKEAQQYQQALNEEEREMAQAVQKVIALEQKKHSLQMQMVNALESEKASIKEQIAHYDRIQTKIKTKYDLENKMTQEQREQIQNLKTINSLEQSRATEKKKQQTLDAKTAQEQREANQKLTADLKEIHRLKMRIAEIEARRLHGGKFGQEEQAQLNVLRQQLAVQADIAQENRRIYSSAGLVTQETYEQLDKLREIQKAELQRVGNAQRIVAENDKASAKAKEQEESFRELLRIEQRIAQLQRDMIFSGMRESQIIQRQVAEERQKVSVMTQELRTQGALTAQREKEIQAIRRASAEQAKLNAKRQEAREKDRAFNDTGGIIDPYTAYANGRQAFDAMLEPMKRVDEAFYRVAKVADASDEALQNFKDTAFDVGTTLGSTASDYMMAVETWVTAGKAFSEAKELGEISQIGAFVGNITPDEMVKYMSVPLNAFEDMGVRAEDIINSMNEVANNNAIEMNDLGKAYVRSATTAKNAGATFAELNGMISAAQEATRKGGERIGTGIKTIGINIQSIQSQWKKIDKTNYDYLSGLGIKLEEDDGSLKSMTRVIEEVVRVQKDLRPDEFSNVIKALAGKEHAETLQAIVDEWETVKKVVKETEDQMNMGKDGSAYIEFAKQSESLRFKLAELRNMWDKLMVDMGDSKGAVTGVLDALISGLKNLYNLAQNPAVVNMLKMIVGMMAIRAGANGMKRLWDAMATGTKSTWKNAVEVATAWKNVRRNVDQATLAVQRFDLAERGASNNNAPHVNGGVILGPDGRPINSNNNQNNPNGNANGNNNNNGNGHGGTTAILGAGGLPNNNNNNANNANGSQSALRGVGKALGKTVGLLPILGDALLLLELTGVPVLETLGKGMDKLFKTTKDEVAETESLIKKFKGGNDLINGTIDAHRSRIQNLESDAVKAGIIKKDEKTGELTAGKGSYMEDEEEFKRFKSDFNNQAEGMGMDIRITMNDTTHILEALKALNVEKEKLAKEEQIKVVEQINKDNTKLGNTGMDVSKFKGDIESANASIKKYQGLIDDITNADGDIIPGKETDYWEYNRQLEIANGNLDKAKENLANVTASYEKTQKAIGDNARALLAEGENFDATAMSKEQAITTTKAMIKEYSKMRKGSSDLVEIQKAVQKGDKLTEDQMTTLIGLNEDYTNTGVDKIRTDKKTRESVLETIKAEQERQKEHLESAEVALTASAKQADGSSKEAKYSKIAKDAIKSKTGVTKESEKAIEEMNKDIDKIPAEKSFTIKIKEVGKKIMDAVKDFFGGKSEVTKKINVETGQGVGIGSGGAMKNVAVGTTRTTRSGRTSASVATGVPVRGAGKAIVSKATASGYKADPNTRVSDEVWRYWNTNRKQDTLESALRDLERAITQAKDDYAKVISNLEKKLPNLRSQQSNQRTLLSQKDAEMNSVLGRLKSFGFKVNTSTNSISNLSHAKNLRGQKAQDAEELLQSFNSLTTEMISITDSIKDLGNQIVATQDEIKQAKIDKELKQFETMLKRITALETSVNNSDALMGSKLSLIGAEDKELSLKVNEEALAKAQSNMKSLIAQFNQLSKANVAYEENGTQLKGTLDSLGQQIIAQADNIIKYRQAINEIEFSRITGDMEEFNKTIDSQNNKLKNNMDNLKEGLLSGTDLNDLASSKGSVLDLSRDNVYEKEAQQRLDLEKKVQDALEAYAKRNVDRAKNVANSTLELNAKMYNQLLTMAVEYTKGNKSTAKQLEASYGDLDDIAKIDEQYAKTAKALEKYYEDVKRKQDELTKKYNNDMANATTSQEKQDLTDQFIMDSLDIEKQYYEAQIKANNEAIKELNSQLADASDADKAKILDQIEAYENSNIEAQNRIKDTIKARFDFEFSLMNQAVQNTNDALKSLQDTYDLLSALGTGNYDGKGTILDAMLEAERLKNSQIKENIADLQEQLGLYEVGSYEWNIINDQLAQYNDQLADSNKQLIEMNKNILANSFSATTSDIERALFGGKSHDAWQQHQQLWMEGLEKEIALEKMYKRMADLGTTVNKEKLDLLAKQEKLSKFEMDYLNKQLDILELQDKVNNLNQQRTIQVLKQNENGQWDWTYEADATQIEQAQDALNEAQLELERLQEKAREDYLQQLQKILADAQNGQYDSVEDFQNALNDLADAFDSVVGDIPEVGGDYIDDLVEAYAQFIKDNAGVVAENPADTYLVQATETMTDSLKQTFMDISKDLGEIFANALLAKLPTTTAVNANKAISSGSTAISIDKIEFPNAKDKDEIQQAILGLPQLALQKAKSKV